MNFFQFLTHLGHVLGILSGNDPTVTNLTTVDGLYTTKLTTPIILDTTTLSTFQAEISDSISTKILTSLPTTDQDIERTKVVTGISAETEPPTKGTSITAESTVGTNATEETAPATNGTTVTENTSAYTNATEETGADTNATSTTFSSVSTSVTEETNGTSTTFSSVSTSVTEETNATSTTITSLYTNATEETNATTASVTGSVPTGTEPTGTGAPSTTVAPEDKSGLSRGAVAGIVIGCLLLIAVIAAAVVFFMKNRNIPPEAQRLRV